MLQPLIKGANFPLNKKVGGSTDSLDDLEYRIISLLCQESHVI